MAIHTRSRDAETTHDEQPVVTAQQSCPGRTVFTERGNSDAWIATNLTLDLER